MDYGAGCVLPLAVDAYLRVGQFFLYVDAVSMRKSKDIIKHLQG